MPEASSNHKVTQSVEVLRISEEGRKNIHDIVVRESPLTIYLNGQELVTLLCTPSHQKCLALGYLLSEGFLCQPGDLKEVVEYGEKGLVHVQTNTDIELNRKLFQRRTITSGCGKGVVFYHDADRLQCQPVESHMSVSAEIILGLMREVNGKSELFKATGGVHSSALCRGQDVVLFREDIGRHNAIDKVLGECFLEGISVRDTLVVTSGRLTSEMVLKVARQSIPVLVSRSAPTDLAVDLARRLHVTLIGFARGSRMTVYAHKDRLNSVVHLREGACKATI